MSLREAPAGIFAVRVAPAGIFAGRAFVLTNNIYRVTNHSPMSNADIGEFVIFRLAVS